MAQDINYTADFLLQEGTRIGLRYENKLNKRTYFFSWNCILHFSDLLSVLLSTWGEIKTKFACSGFSPFTIKNQKGLGSTLINLEMYQSCAQLRTEPWSNGPKKWSKGAENLLFLWVGLIFFSDIHSVYHFTYSLPPIHFSPSILLGWNFDSRTRKMRVYWLENFNSDESRLSKSSDKFSPISDPMTHANWLLPRKVRKWEGKIIRHFFVTGCWNYGVLYSRAYNTHISYLIYFHDKKKSAESLSLIC